MAKYMEHKRDTELFVAGSLEELLPEDSVAREVMADSFNRSMSMRRRCWRNWG